MVKEDSKSHILEGPVVKSIFLLAVPIMLANILQTVYQLIDTFWVGRLGVDAVAAVSLSFPVLFFLISLAGGFTMAGSILVAQYNGKKDKRRVNFATGQTLALTSFVAIIISIIGYFSSGFLLGFLTKDANVLVQATSYLQISFLGLVTLFIFTIFQTSLRGVGEVKFPMYIVFTTVVLNFFLDPLFMLGYGFIPALGVAGVAWATVVTQSVSALVGVFILVRGKHGIKIRLSDIKLKWRWSKRLAKLGLPSSIEQSSRSFSMVLMTFLVSLLGTMVVATYGLGTRILMFVIIPAVSFSVASSALIGNNLGAQQYSRAKEISKVGMKIAFLTLSGVGAVLFIFANQLIGFFVPGETELIAAATLFIRIMALSFGFIGIQMVIIGTLRAAGKTKLSMFLAIFNLVVLFILSLIFSKGIGLEEIGIWIAYPISNVLSAGFAYYFYKKGDWVKALD